MNKELESEIRNLVREALRDVLDETRGRLDEMARVSKFLDNYDIVIRTDDPGYIPHVHIIDLPTRGRDFDCCVQLETNKYFQHGTHQDIMPAKWCKEFYDIMCQPHRNIHVRNVYEYAVNLWNDNNSSSYVQIKEDANGNVIVPDYRHILPYK